MIEDNEIIDFREITSENPVKQIWKLLRFFQDESSASEMIRRIHGIEKGEHNQNVKKQARQIGYCIRQAEEYFHASSQVKLPTRPLLLYYGASSLAWALILLRKDGKYSFDKLREERKHKHHGLDLVGEFRSRDGLEDFLNSLQCKCYTKEDKTAQKDIPWGTFPLFYESLVPCAYHVSVRKYRDREVFPNLPDPSTFLRYDISYECGDLLPLDSLVRKSLNTMELITFLPDIHPELIELDIRSNLCEGGMDISIFEHYQGEEVTKQERRYHFQYRFTRSGEKARFLELIRSRNPDIILKREFRGGADLELVREYSPSEDGDPGWIPNIMDDISGKKFYILKPEVYVPEPAAHFILLYCLGMLSRYYPDKWMEAIDSDVQITEFTDSLLNVIYRKFPNLILDQMRRAKHYVHI